MANPSGNMSRSTQIHQAHKPSFPSHSLSHSHSQPSRIVQEKSVIVISSDEDEPRQTSKSDGFRATQGPNQAITNGCRLHDQSHKPTASSSRNAPKDGTPAQNGVLRSQEARHRVDSLSNPSSHAGTQPSGSRLLFDTAKRVAEPSRLESQMNAGQLHLSKDTQAAKPAERSTISREALYPMPYDMRSQRAVETLRPVNDRESHVSKDAQASRVAERSTGSKQLLQNAVQSASSASNSQRVGEQQVSRDAQASIPLKRSIFSREVFNSVSITPIEPLSSKHRTKDPERPGSKGSDATLPRELPNHSRQICVPLSNRLVHSESSFEQRAVLGQERVVGSSSDNTCEQRFQELYKSQRAVPVQGRVFGSSTETPREHRISEVSRSQRAIPSQGLIVGSSRDILREPRLPEACASVRVAPAQERVGRSSEKSHPELLRSERVAPAILPLTSLPLQSASRLVPSQTSPQTPHMDATLPDSDAHARSKQPSDASRDRSKQPSETSHTNVQQPSETSHTNAQQPSDSSHAHSKQPSGASRAQSQQSSACPLHSVVPAAPFPKIPIKEKPRSPDWSLIPPHRRPLQGPVRPDEFSDGLQKTWILENKPHLGTRHGRFIFSEEINSNQMWENPEIPSIEVNVPDEVRELMSDPKKAKEFRLDNSLAPPLEYVYTDRIVYRNNERPIPPKWHCNCHGDCRNNPQCECRAYQTYMIQAISESVDHIDIKNFEGFAYTSTRRPPNSHAKKTDEADPESRILRDSFIQYTLPVFECNSLCGCGPDCLNRTVGRGRREKLSIDKTLFCGWGVFAGNQIIPGRLVTHYSGELISEKMTAERDLAYDEIKRTYVFTLDPWWITYVYIHNLENDGFMLIDENVQAKRAKTSQPQFGSNVSLRNKRVISSLSASKKQHSVIKEQANDDDDDCDDDDGFGPVHCVDAFWYGNVSRYINHSCSANTTIVPVYIDDGDPTRPIFAMFANKLIKRGKEITTSYCDPHEDPDEEADAQMANAGTSQRTTVCKCGAPNCRGKMFA